MSTRILRRKEEKAAKKKIEKLKRRISKMLVAPDTFAYIKLYQALQGLYFTKKYKLVCEVCDLLLNE